MIPYSHQSISEADIDAVVEVLKSDWLTQGPKVREFEAAFARYCTARFGAAVSHGTAALHLACLALELGPGDVLWTSVNTFVASANCARYCGADVDFVDIDPRTYNLSLDALREKLAAAERDGVLPKVLVVVHFAGQPCPMQEIQQLSHRYGFRVIEDASHAAGARYRETPVGSGEYSDLTVFSFHPVKPMTTGEGGMVLTNRQELDDKILLLRSHGINRQPHGAQERPWYYEQVDLGFNYRMTDLQAALGLSQMQQLAAFNARRHALAARYRERLADLPLILPWQDPAGVSSYHLFPIQLALDKDAEAQRLRVYKELHQSGILVNVHYIPLHYHPYYRDMGWRRGDFPEAERYYQRCLSLPLYQDLSEAQQDKVISALRQILQGARAA